LGKNVMNVPLKRNQNSFDAFASVGCQAPLRLTSSNLDSGVPVRRYAPIPPTSHSISGHSGSTFSNFRNTFYESDKSRRKKRLLGLIHRFSIEGELNSVGERIKISGETARAASALFASLPNDFCLPKIALEGDGGLTAVWEADGRKLILVVDDWKLHFINYATTPNAEYFDNYRFDGERVPTELISIIPRQ